MLNARQAQKIKRTVEKEDEQPTSHDHELYKPTSKKRRPNAKSDTIWNRGAEEAEQGKSLPEWDQSQV